MSPFYVLCPLENHDRIQTITLTDLPLLKSLIANSNSHLTTLGGQFNTPKLDNITLDNNALESLEGLSGLPELTSISAGGNMLTDVEFITTLPKLDVAHFGENCLDADALEVWVDWWNEHRTSELTVEEALEGQNPDGKCGY